MTERQVCLFGEDVGHERLLLALVRRVAQEEGVAVRVVTGSAAGGHGRVVSELKLYQRAIVATSGSPDLLVVAVDANCEGWSQAKDKLEKEIDHTTVPCHALAVPDPHIERWYMADPDALWKALEVNVVPQRRKCDRGIYKKTLTDALVAGGYPVTLGGAEFAEDIVEHMDLFKAGKSEPSLKHFLEEVRALLKAWKL